MIETAIKKIRKKFIITAVAISFSVIALMVIVLNLIMNINYEKENRILTDMIYQTAVVNASSVSSESFKLSEMKRTSSGDYIVPVNVNNISRLILYGEISHTLEESLWFCGGGGVIFNFQKSDGEIIGVHKEYMFNKDNKNISIDFNKFDDVMRNGEYVSLDNGKIIGDNIIITSAWWTASDQSEPNQNDENVKLELTNVTVIYKNGTSPADFDGYNIKYKNFNDVFIGDMPEALNSSSCFYMVTDEHYNIIEINKGNFINEFADDEYYEISEKIKVSDKKDGIIELSNGISYKYKIKSEDNMNVVVFIHNSSNDKFLRQLLIISTLIGLALMFILFLIIISVSNNVIKPVRTAFEKQKEFISNASHELKTPVTVISATADLIRNETGENRWINCISEQSEKMGRLVNELLSLARLSEFDNAVKVFTEFDMSRTVNNAILYFECRAYEENRKIECNIKENITFSGDENKISELVNILIDNALKYSTENSTINVNLYEVKNKICLECINSCEDIEKIDVNKLFERFYREETVQTSEKSGFGLGLSIAHSIVEYHKGSIKAVKDNEKIKFIILI